MQNDYYRIQPEQRGVGIDSDVALWLDKRAFEIVVVVVTTAAHVR